MAGADGCDADAGTVSAEQSGSSSVSLTAFDCSLTRTAQTFSYFHVTTCRSICPRCKHAIEAASESGNDSDGEITWRGGKVAYHVFDILWLDGRNVTHARSKNVASSWPDCRFKSHFIA
jgi:hypothetical protein